MTNLEKFQRMQRMMGRRSGGDRRSAEYAIYLPERRQGERRKYDRRQQGLSEFLELSSFGASKKGKA